LTLPSAYNIREIAEMGPDIERVKAHFWARYGYMPPDEFVADFIAYLWDIDQQIQALGGNQ
jgi:hypothetical protein